MGLRVASELSALSLVAPRRIDSGQMMNGSFLNQPNKIKGHGRPSAEAILTKGLVAVMLVCFVFIDSSAAS